ncbi:hypothetical protein LZ30DRAFT_691665 [Colletotrichum cereale]|nr:hypothetical protein LZ30DRAFT_691665 [Colletotrichum cereale]
MALCHIECIRESSQQSDEPRRNLELHRGFLVHITHRASLVSRGLIASAFLESSSPRSQPIRLGFRLCRTALLTLVLLASPTPSRLSGREESLIRNFRQWQATVAGVGTGLREPSLECPSCDFASFVLPGLDQMNWQSGSSRNAMLIGATLPSATPPAVAKLLVQDSVR